MNSNRGGDSEIIGGVNPVLEALRARGRTFIKLYLARGRHGPFLDELNQLARENGLKVERVDRSQLDRLYGGRGHQGVAARVGPYSYADLEDVLDRAAGEQALVLVLDGLEDPGNLGSLIRSAEAAGAAGIIMPRERSAPLSPAALKASAGAAEYLPVARVVNLARAIEELKSAGFWVLGAEAGAEANLYEQDLAPRLALVVGGEGRGLRRLIKEKCDHLVRIPIQGRTGSLNAAVAGALAMFEYVRQHPARDLKG